VPASYDPTLPTDKDWVRFMAGDRDISRALLDDGEIYGLLREFPNKYLAAAQACEAILARSQGLVTKQVDDLRLQWSDSSTAENVYSKYIRHLRERGAKLTIQKSSRFRVL